MLVGFYGGTFDPVHRGHCHVANQVAQALQLDKIRLVLSARPGHRVQPHASIEHRWEMLKLACQHNELLVADDCEVKRHGMSFTIDTVEEFVKRNPDSLPCWILGQDSFATLPTWHRYEELLNYCNLVVVDRPQGYVDEPEVVKQLCYNHEQSQLDSNKVGQIVRLSLTMLPISATEIRQQRVQQCTSWQDKVPKGVASYIQQHQLYVEQQTLVKEGFN